MDSAEQPKRPVAGIFYAAIWLLFLGFPVASALGGPAGPAWTTVALVAAIAFAAVYIWLFWVLSGEDVGVAANRRRLMVGVLALAALAALATPAAGPWVAAFTPFIAAVLVFSLPLVPGLAAGILVWLVPSSVAAQFSGTLWTLLGPGFGVAVIVFARLMEHNERRARDAQNHLQVAAERNAIARDVHDVLGHSLTVLSIKAQLARRLLDLDVDRAREELDQIDALARESLGQIRSTVTRLRTPSLASELEAARTALEAAGIRADVVVDPEVRDDGGDLFAWAVREGVTNTVRHSGATHCRIDVRPATLTIADDGAGCGGAEHGNGLLGLRERARGVGARVEVRPTHPEDERPGTTLEVRR
ncbi:sensor histidine kinase [Zhihengliuella sp.]|uniref:sensor histidine kinase n=1 Tax=Zhihengliuella sp. TaxID=1954483 RepID=UPI0028122114|nr:sensor histidine kinase [Zhihengliuella sp.]